MPRIKISPNDEMAINLQGAGYKFERESKLIPGRRYAVDFLITMNRRFGSITQPVSLVLEVEGITYGGGRHQRVDGFEKDCEKYAELLVLGYSLLRVTQKMVRNGKAIDYVNKFYRR